MSLNQLPTSDAAAQTLVPWEQVEKFVGQVSHDLRNGLNACELQLSLLTELVSDPETLAEVKQLRQSLGGITKQLQALRTSTTAPSTHPLEYPAVDLFEDLRERFNRTFPQEASRVDWQAEVDAKRAVLVDPEAALSALLELLGNAVVFSEKAGHIRCELLEQTEALLLRVEHHISTAPAVPLEQWGLTPLVSTRRGAYGLGLFRAKRVLRAQDVELSFRYDAGPRLLSTLVALPSKPS